MNDFLYGTELRFEQARQKPQHIRWADEQHDDTSLWSHVACWRFKKYTDMWHVSVATSSIQAYYAELQQAQEPTTATSYNNDMVTEWPHTPSPQTSKAVTCCQGDRWFLYMRCWDVIKTYREMLWHGTSNTPNQGSGNRHQHDICVKWSFHLNFSATTLEHLA